MSTSIWKGCALVVVGMVIIILLCSQNNTNANISAIYDATTTQNVDKPFEVETIAFRPSNTSLPSSSHDLHNDDQQNIPAAVGGVVDPAHDDNLITPAPELVMDSSAADQMTIDARKNIHPARTTSRCDWRAMQHLAVLDPTNGTWSYRSPHVGGSADAHSSTTVTAAAEPRSLCNGNLIGVTFPITGAQLLKHFNGKRIVFMGDSVARNSFVLTMARMCNEDHFDQCITRTPTMEFDVVNPPNNRGPMGCVPNETDMNVKSLCYEHGKFANIPLRGLTLRSVPQDRNGRRNFIRKGLIGPVMAMNYGNVSLLYHPVTKPNQLTRTGLWMRHRPNSLLHADVIIVSIGPHLRLPEVQATPETLIQGLAALRAATSAPIIAAEFVHALASTPQYMAFVDGLMDTLRSKMEQLDVTMVPQRYITKHGFMLSSGKVNKSEAPGTVQKGCGYYDPQHPALRCQMTTSDMLLGAAMIQMLQQQQQHTPQQQR